MQSKRGSFLEAIINVVVGYSINFVASMVLIPAIFGISISVRQNLTLGAFYTVISIARSYALRRLFNRITLWRLAKAGRIV